MDGIRKWVSAWLCLVMVAGAFALMETGSEPARAVTITGDVTWSNETIYLEEPLLVTGNLTLRNVDLICNATTNGSVYIEVASSGRLSILDDSLVTWNNTNHYYIYTNGTLIVKNSTIEYAGYGQTGFGPGVSVDGDGCVIDNSTFRYNYMGITLLRSSNHRITDNGFFDMPDRCIAIYHCSDSVILSNNISNTGFIGVGDCSGVTIRNNAISPNGYSIDVTDSVDVVIEDNLMGQSHPADNSTSNIQGGIQLYNASVTIDFNRFDGLSHGVDCWYSTDVSIMNNSFENISYSAISFWDSASISIISNAINATTAQDGIFIDRSSSFIVSMNEVRNTRICCVGYVDEQGDRSDNYNSLVSNNRIQGSYLSVESADGITIENNIVNNSNLYVEDSEEVTVTRNRVYSIEDRNGIHLSNVNDSEISMNLVKDSGRYGLFLENSNNNAIWGNALIGNGWQSITGGDQAQQLGTGNVWDADYPKGGNYWGFSGDDEFSGKTQDIPGCDGIGDATYDDYLIVDRYPLTREPDYWSDRPPIIELLSHANNSFISPGTEIKFYAWDANRDLHSVKYALDGGTDMDFSVHYRLITTGLHDGPVSVRVKATDAVGRIAYGIYGFTIDGTPPYVVSCIPVNGSMEMPVNTTVVITFSEPMNTTSVEAGLSTSPVIAGLGKAWGAGNTTLTFKVATNFSANASYRVTIGTEAMDLAGNPLADAYVTEFKTWVDTDGDGLPDSEDPDDDNDGVPDLEDAFPFDPDESIDTDGDGIGNNADPDDDNDGVLDEDDPDPLNPNITGKEIYLYYAVAIVVAAVCLAIFAYLMLRKKQPRPPAE